MLIASFMSLKFISQIFVPSSKPFKIEFVKPKEDVPALRKIRVDIK